MSRRILVIVPNKLRDLEGHALTGFHLSRCYGHDVRYTTGLHVQEALRSHAPDLLVIDHLAWDYRAEQASLAKRQGARLVVLPTSGLFQDVTDHELIVGRAFQASKLVDCYLTWGDQGRQILIENGLMAATQIRTVGCPRFDFYSAPYISLIGPRTTFLESIGVSRLDSPVIVWAPANVASVAVGPAALARWAAGTNLDPAVFKPEMDDVLDQYNEHAPLILELAHRRPTWTVVTKVHPSDQLSRFHWMREKAANIHVVQNVPIRELLYHCDVLLQRASTTANEAWLLGRPVLSLATRREALKISPEYAEGNETVRTLDEAIAKTEAFVKDPRIPEAQQRARAAFIAKTYYRVDGRASERAAQAIHELVCSSARADAAQGQIPSATPATREESGLGEAAGVTSRLKGILGMSLRRSLRFWRRTPRPEGSEEREGSAPPLDSAVEALYAQFARLHTAPCASDADAVEGLDLRSQSPVEGRSIE